MDVAELRPPRPAARPVFVDPAGRRARRVALAARLVALLTAAYLALVGASLVGAPWVPRLALPSVGPVPNTVRTAPAVTLPPSAPHQPLPNLARAEVGPASHEVTTVPGTTPAGDPANPGRPTTTAGPGTVSPPPTSVAPAPTVVPPGQGRRSPTTTAAVPTPTPTTAPPGHSGTAPGKGH